MQALDAVRLIHLWGKGDKPRTIDIHPALMPELVKWRIAQRKQAETNPDIANALSHPDTEFVLLTNQGKKLSDGALWKALKCRAARVGVMPVEPTRDKRGRATDNKSAITPHMLRRTFATKLLRSGTDLDTVADTLGHSSLDTTRKHYAFASDERTRHAINSFQI